MGHHERVIPSFAFILPLLLSLSCNFNTVERSVSTPGQFVLTGGNAKKLTLFMNNGYTFVLNTWSVDTVRHRIYGTGSQIDRVGVVFYLNSVSVNESDVSVSESNISATEGTTTGRVPIKVHGKDGSVTVLDTWSFDHASKVISGSGAQWNADRDLVSKSFYSLPSTDVALIEKNTVERSSIQSAFTVLITGNVVIAAICLTNPKACFGSCPTFYAQTDSGEALVAEGFSASILPVLEATDIDALVSVHPKNRVLPLRMTNEALETHSIRSADIIAVRRKHGGTVYISQDEQFYEARSVVPLSSALGSEGDCTELLRSFDSRERFSAADSFDLAGKETIELTFPSASFAHAGLILGFRHTLLSTYLFYQTLAYMGTSAGTLLAKIQSKPEEFLEHWQGPSELLGGIEVQIPEQNGGWRTVQVVKETGPIARNMTIVPLLEGAPATKIRLRMTKGMWRIDQTAMAEIVPVNDAVQIGPRAVYRDGKPDSTAFTQLTDPLQLLNTYPGDEYTIEYLLPEDFSERDLFLKSRGYYIEWMRDVWMKDENLARIAQLVSSPKQFLRTEAPRFKQAEQSMEQIFWSSKYVRPKQ